MRTAQNSAQLDRQFFALSDATRRQMLERLGAGPASVSELMEPLDMAMSSVVKHLALLEAGGLVQSDKSGRVRTYRLDAAAFVPIERWVALRKKTLESQFDRLDRLLSNTQTKKP